MAIFAGHMKYPGNAVIGPEGDDLHGSQALVV